MEELQVRRWRKGPHDRLYVKTRTGIEVGWIDVRTQRQHLTIPGMWPEFSTAVSRWRESNPLPTTAPPSGPAPAVPRPRPGRPAPVTDEDLAGRRPGAGLDARVEELQIPNPALRWLGRMLRVRTRDRAWRVGAAGERAVGRRLDKLQRRGWAVLHSVELGGGGDVDHLLIGPAGVLTVNAKHHRGAVVEVQRAGIRVRGRAQPYAERARREATRVHQALSTALGRPVHVAPLVVVHGHARLSGWVLRRPHGVQVLPSWAVTWWYRLPSRAVLDDAEIAAVYAAARRASTWASA